MPKWCSSLVLDNGLNYLYANANEFYVCSLQPSDYSTLAGAGVVLGTTTLTTGAVGDWTIANGDADSSGRKITCSSQTCAISTSGTARFIAVTSSNTLLYVTTCSTQALSSGGTVSTPAWDIEIAATT
jgi:hypothetical protein